MAQSLAQVVQERVQKHPEKMAMRFLDDGEIESEALTFRDLDKRARAVAMALQEKCKGQDRALLLLPSGTDFVAAFFGCLYANVIAVPAFPPMASRDVQRLFVILQDAGATVVLSDRATTTMMQAMVAKVPEVSRLTFLAVDEIVKNDPAGWQPGRYRPEDVAFLQYTSGSTSAPKGVMVSNKNVLATAEMIQRSFNMTESTVKVSWLPVFHDLGLIGSIQQPLYAGSELILMSPTVFLGKPLRWLQAVTKYRGTVTGGPNFAFELCLRRITPEERLSLDISSLAVMYNGAEPIRKSTLKRFSDGFAPAGFKESMFFSAYGLAEATLMVAGSSIQEAPAYLQVKKASLELGRIEEASRDTGVDLVSTGLLGLQEKLVIVSPDTNRVCGDDEVGEIWIAGDNVTLGYWGKKNDTEEVFRAKTPDRKDQEFCRTGDLGFTHGKDLFITGRLKDLIIVNGRNCYPQDIERTVEESHVAIRTGCAAAFSFDDGQGEKVAVVAEIKKDHLGGDHAAVINDIQLAIAKEQELKVSLVALIEPGKIPKTSSGKIQRRACKRALLEKALMPVHEWREKAVSATAVVPDGGGEGGEGHDWEKALVKVVKGALQGAKLAIPGELRLTLGKNITALITIKDEFRKKVWKHGDPNAAIARLSSADITAAVYIGVEPTADSSVVIEKTPPVPIQVSTSEQRTEAPKAALVKPALSQREIEDGLADWLSKRLDAPMTAAQRETPLTALGFESVTAVELALFVEDWLSIKVPDAFAWEHPTVSAMARFLYKEGHGGAGSRR